MTQHLTLVQRARPAATAVLSAASRTPKATSAINPDPRFILDRRERTRGALYFYNNRQRMGRRKSEWVWGAFVTAALFPKFPQKAVNQAVSRDTKHVWEEYLKWWTEYDMSVHTSIRKNSESRTITATVPIAVFKRDGYPPGMARFAVATYGADAQAKDFWKESVDDEMASALRNHEYTLEGVSPRGSLTARELEHFRAANGRIVIRTTDTVQMAYLKLEFTQRESEFLCNSPWLEIRPMDFFGVISSWVGGRFGQTAKSPAFTIPLGRIAKASDAKVAAPRVSEDGLSLDEHGVMFSIPPKLNQINEFEDKSSSLYSRPDGTFSLVDENGEKAKPPDSMPVYVDWVNLKFAYTTNEGKLAIKNLDRVQPVTVTHIRQFLETPIIDSYVKNFLTFTLRLGEFFHVPESPAGTAELLNALEKENARNELYKDVNSCPLVAIQELALAGGNEYQQVLHRFCATVKKVATFIRENPVNAYARYSVQTVIELKASLEVFSKYAIKFGEVKAQDNTKRSVYDEQGVDKAYATAAVPFVLPDRGLMPHQAKVENLLRGVPDNAMLDVDAGGGKTTVVVTEILRLMKNGGNNLYLVMCPAHLVAQYVKEFVYFTGSQVNVIPVTSYSIRRHGFERLTQMVLQSPTNTVIVTDYNAIVFRRTSLSYGATPIRIYPTVDFLRQFPIKYVAADESHQLKNGSNKNEAAGRLFIDIQKRRLASGTMVSDTLIDLVRQTALLDPSVFGTVEDFVRKYALEVKGTKVIEWKPGAQLAIQQALKKNVVVATAKRKEWAAILPQPIEKFHFVELTQGQEGVYKSILDTIQEEVRKAAETNKELKALLNGEVSEEDSDINLDALLKPHLARLEMFMSAPGMDPAGKLVLSGEDLVSAKVEKIAEICRDHLNEGIRGKVLIFTNYSHSAQSIYEGLPADLRAKTIYYTADRKDECAAQFDQDASKQIMVGIEQSMNTGVNLQIASRLIRVETVWSPGTLEQGNSRIGRPNVKVAETRKNIYYDWLVANKTIDITKISYLIGKTISKAKFDEAGNPRFEELEVPVLFSMTLDNVLSMNDWRDSMMPYYEKYEAYKQAVHAEFTEYREKNKDALFSLDDKGDRVLKMDRLQKAPNTPGAAVMHSVPYVPGMELYRASAVGLVRYDEYMRLDAADLEDAEGEEDGGDDEGEGDANAEDESGEDDGVIDPKDVARQARRAALAEERLKAIGLKVHTEFGDGEVIRLNQKLLTVRMENGGEFRVRKMASFVLTKQNKSGKDTRTLLLKQNGDLPIDTNTSIDDTAFVKMKLRKRREAEEEAALPEEVQEDTVEMVLDFTVVNDFLGIRLVNTDNEAAVRVAQSFGFKHPPAYFAAKIAYPHHLIRIFRAWNELGFEMDKSNSAACYNAYKHILKTKNEAPNFYGVASTNDIRNFYKLEFRPNPDKKHINPYPLFQDDELYLCLPKAGQPGSVPAMRKAMVPGVKWMAYDSDTDLIAFTPRKEKASVLIKKLLNEGIVIPNIKELAQKFKRLRIARDVKGAEE